jgi:RimJ/RimL family protein N-acetyltransferase
MDWAVDTLGWAEVVHTIAADNAPSKAVAARLGSRFLRMGRLPAPFDVELEVWGQSAQAWRGRDGAAP